MRTKTVMLNGYIVSCRLPNGKLWASFVYDGDAVEKFMDMCDKIKVSPIVTNVENLDVEI